LLQEGDGIGGGGDEDGDGEAHTEDLVANEDEDVMATQHVENMGQDADDDDLEASSLHHLSRVEGKVKKMETLIDSEAPHNNAAS
jgi:hypothetical protein